MSRQSQAAMKAFVFAHRDRHPDLFNLSCVVGPEPLTQAEIRRVRELAEQFGQPLGRASGARQ